MKKKRGKTRGTAQRRTALDLTTGKGARVKGGDQARNHSDLRIVKRVDSY